MGWFKRLVLGKEVEQPDPNDELRDLNEKRDEKPKGDK